ncbi:MAG: GNAT family N-acetyltransferase [Candidatus Methanomethylophilus sp.]|nr:GNAT family N-acetyltransferase [Methanomethylophilus sp.]
MEDRADMRLEFIGPDKAEEISEIAFPLFREVYSIVPSDVVEGFLRKTQTPEAIREQMENGLEYAYIIHKGEKAGYVAFGIDAEGMYLSKFYLFNGYRRLGLGSWVLDYVERRARELGAERIHLDVNTDNAPAIAFYGKHGFVMGENITFMRAVMTKDLR